jgi:Predicted permeases
LNGKALDVSLGYLLMPLAMVVCGRVVYKDTLQPYQKAAVVCAALGVANQVVQVGGLSWATLIVPLGYPLYFMLRKRLRADNLGGLWADMTLMLPSAFLALYVGEAPVAALWANRPALMGLLPFLGVISALSVALFVLAGQLLPLSLFGLLGYVEPVLLVVVSLLLGETIQMGEVPTYFGVGLAVVILALGGARSRGKAR